MFLSGLFQWFYKIFDERGEIFMGILEIILILLVISWLGGFSLKVGGGLIHILLVIAVIVLIVRLLGITV